MRFIAAALVSTIVLSTTPALATPLSTKRAQARQAKTQVEALNSKVDVATEDYLEAKLAYDRLTRKIRRLRDRLAKIESQTDTLQTSLNTRADSMYRSGPLGVLDVLLGTASFDDFAATWDMLNEWNKQESSTVAKLKDLRADALVSKAELETSQASAKTVYDKMTDRRDAIVADLNKAKSLVRGLESEIRAIEAADRARRAADARQYGGSGDGGWDWGNPSRSPRSGVVQIALRYLGRPYRWAASGPSSFDCSGFTMFVYAQVGVSLPHSSRSQINSGQRVSRSNLQPGDLVFFGHPIHHVGMYIGGGRMVHAPHTGDVVSIDPISRMDYAGACRP